MTEPLTVKQIANSAGVSVQYVRTLIRRGIIPARFDGTWQISETVALEIVRNGISQYVKDARKRTKLLTQLNDHA